MLTKDERLQKKRLLQECRENGNAITQELIRGKHYAGKHALWAEAWIAARQRPLGAYALAIVAIFISVLAWLFPR